VEANKRADSLARKLEQKEKALKKAESDAAIIEDLRKRLHEAENALSDKVTEQSARETDILRRLQSQSRSFISKYPNPYALLRIASLSLAYLSTRFPFACFQGGHTKSMNWKVLKATSFLTRFRSWKSMEMKHVKALLTLKQVCRSFSHISFRRKRSPIPSSLLPSHSMCQKILG
jgi:hypothetical protein